MHWDVIPARHLACPVVVPANAIRVRCIEGLDEILAHHVSAVIGAAEALQRTILQGDRLKLCKNCLAQAARRSAAHEIANHDGSRCYESDNDERDANGGSQKGTEMYWLIRLRGCTFEHNRCHGVMLGVTKRN